MPSATTRVGEPTVAAMLFISRIMQPAISAAIEPTDRSMPPEMITKVMLIAMIPTNDHCRRMLPQFSGLRNAVVPRVHFHTRP